MIIKKSGRLEHFITRARCVRFDEYILLDGLLVLWGGALVLMAVNAAPEVLLSHEPISALVLTGLLTAGVLVVVVSLAARRGRIWANLVVAGFALTGLVWTLSTWRSFQIDRQTIWFRQFLTLFLTCRFLQVAIERIVMTRRNQKANTSRLLGPQNTSGSV